MAVTRSEREHTGSLSQISQTLDLVIRQPATAIPGGGPPAAHAATGVHGDINRADLFAAPAILLRSHS